MSTALYRKIANVIQPTWRFPDERWLVCRTTIGNFDLGESQTHFSLGDAMPR
jgi:hypothetical protein